MLLAQALWFHQHGHRVKAVFFYDKENLLKKWRMEYPFSFYTLSRFEKDSRGVKRMHYILEGIWNFWRILRAEKIDVIMTYTHDRNIVGIPLAWLRGIPARIATHHGVIDNIPRWREVFHALMVNWGIANVLIAVSNKTRNRAIEEGVQPEHIQVITNGIVPIEIEKFDRDQIRRELDLPADGVFILSVGRLSRQKAHEVLIEAIPAVLAKSPNAKIGICGDGDQRALLESKIQKLGVKNSVTLYGTQDNVARFLAAADIFVLPSRSEGMPLALLEAMSAELPVIATRVEGITEVVLDGVEGLLVPSEDPAALAQSISRLCADMDLRYKLGLAARKKVQSQYTIDATCQEYMRTILKYVPVKG